MFIIFSVINCHIIFFIIKRMVVLHLSVKKHPGKRPINSTSSQCGWLTIQLPSLKAAKSQGLREPTITHHSWQSVTQHISSSSHAPGSEQEIILLYCELKGQECDRRKVSLRGNYRWWKKIKYHVHFVIL